MNAISFSKYGKVRFFVPGITLVCIPFVGIVYSFVDLSIYLNDAIDKYDQYSIMHNNYNQYSELLDTSSPPRDGAQNR